MKSINRQFLSLTLAGVLGGFTAASALAVSMPDFKSADSNGDGMVSPAEFFAKGGEEKAFNEGDANRDKKLSSDEYITAVANNDRAKAGKAVNDAWITAKVKTLILKDESLKGLAVNVETYGGMVQLSGWVKTQEQIVRAGKIALGVEGVKDVRNDLQVKG